MKASATGSINIEGLVPVKSSFVRGVQYIKPERLLIVHFDKSSYIYRKVKQAVATRMVKAKSVGRYFYRNIRGKYEYERID